MPDWRNEVARVLASGKFSAEERDEVARELACYLDDLFNDACARGLSERAAMKHAIAQLYEDPRLGPKLRRARQENNMNDRTKRFWLPGCIILLASAAALALFDFAGFSPYFPRAWVGNVGAEPFLHDSLMIYVPWLCVLPFLGAAGAYWSRRTGGAPALRIAVGIFPAFVFLATFLVWVPLCVAIGALPPGKIFLPAFAGLILSWVVIPGAALLLGVLPFLGGSSAHRRIA
ncbi:MAG: hypothetical protein WA876_06720 [Candidatus Acidiferrales bacterium]